MSELPPPAGPPRRAVLTWRRVLVWVLVGGLGLFLVITGLVGIIAKGG